MVCQCCLHRGRNAESLMDRAEIVLHEMERQRTERAASEGGPYTYCSTSFLREKQIPRSARDDTWTEKARRGGRGRANSSFRRGKRGLSIFVIGLAVIGKMQIPRFARNDNSRGFRRALRLCLMDSGLPSFAVHSQEWLCHWSER